VQNYDGVNLLGQPDNFRGDRLPFTPTWSANINADYRFSGLGNVIATADTIGRYAGRPATYGVTVGFKM
jgi:hypothetical protein